MVELLTWEIACKRVRVALSKTDMSLDECYTLSESQREQVETLASVYLFAQAEALEWAAECTPEYTMTRTKRFLAEAVRLRKEAR